MSGIAPIPGATPASLDVSSVSADASRLATRANLEQAGKQFEAVFTQMMLKSMRNAHLAEDIFGSQAGNTFRDMQDQKLSQTMANNHPLGIGKALVDFLSKTQQALQPPGDSANAANPADAADRSAAR